MKWPLPTLAVLLLLISPAGAQDVTTGFESYMRGDHAVALAELRPYAERGDAEAQYIIGFIYHVGRAVPQDFAEAASWYRKAAEQAYVNAQIGLGDFC